MTTPAHLREEAAEARSTAKSWGAVEDISRDNGSASATRYAKGQRRRYTEKAQRLESAAARMERKRRVWLREVAETVSELGMEIGR